MMSVGQRIERGVKEAGLAAAIIAVFAVWQSGTYLKLDLWYDEVYTLAHFVFVPFRKIVTDYSYPNNHIFANIINWFYLQLLGIPSLDALLDSPQAIRLLMLLFSIVTLAYVFAISRRFLNNRVGYLALAILATTIPYFNFATQVRGYTLSMMLLCMLVYHAWSFEESSRKRDAALVVALATLSLYTIPLNLYFLLSVAAFYAVRGAQRQPAYAKELRRNRAVAASSPGSRRELGFINNQLWLVVLILVSPALAAVLYSPVMQSVVNNRFVERTVAFNADTIVKTMPQVFVYFVSGRGFLCIFAILGVAGWIGLASTPNRDAWRAKGAFCATVLVLPFVLSALRGDSPFDRVFVNLAPVFALFTAAGSYCFLESLIKHKGWALVLTILLTGYCFYVFAGALREKDARLSQDIERGVRAQDIYYNYFQAHYAPSKLAASLSERGAMAGTTVYVDSPGDDEALPRYLKKERVSAAPFEEVTQSTFDEKKEIYVITAFPRFFEVKIAREYPGVQCTRSDPGPHFQAVFVCRTQ